MAALGLEWRRFHGSLRRLTRHSPRFTLEVNPHLTCRFWSVLAKGSPPDGRWLRLTIWRLGNLRSAAKSLS